MIVFFAATLATALMTPDLPESERLRIDAPFFDPRPGESLVLDPVEMRDSGRRTAPTSLRGFLTVKPPRGHCLTITRDPGLPDEIICEKT